MNIKRNATIQIFLAIFLVACSFGGDSTISQAKKYLGGGDYQRAILTYKNILKKHPDDKNVRVLLANVYLTVGDGPSAEKELNKAKKLGSKENEYVLPLIKALVLQDKLNSALESSRPLDSVPQATNTNILAEKGNVYLAMNNIKNAIDAYQQALSYDAGNETALQGMIAVSLKDHDLDKAEQNLSKLLKISPDNARSWNIKAAVEASSGKHAESEKSYQKALGLLKEKQISRLGFTIRSGLIQEQLRQNKLDQALVNVDDLMKGQPKSLLPKYMRALIAYEKNNYKEANDYLSDVVYKAPKYLPGRFLMGAVQYALGNYDSARDNLEYVVNEVPTQIQARKMLARVYFKLRNPEDALKVLSANKGEDSNDSQLLAMMGRAAMSSGDLNRSVKLYKKAVELAPDETGIRAELADIYMKQGGYGSAINELEKIGGKGKKQAEKMIIYALIREQKYDEAIAKTKELAKDDKNDPTIPAILGVINLGRGDRERAREEFIKSYNLDKAYEPAANTLARMDFEEGNLEGAEGWYNKIIEKNSRSLRALLGMAQISEKKGDSDSALKWVKKAQESNPKSLVPVTILTNYYIKHREYDKANTDLAKAEKSLPGNSQISQLKVKVLIAQGDRNGAAEILKQLINKQKNNLTYYIQLALILDTQNRIEEARQTINNAKDNVSLTTKKLAAIVRTEIVIGDTKNALSLINEQKKKNSRELPVWLTLEGDAYFKQKKYSLAETSYKQALDLSQASINALKLTNVRFASGNKSGATSFANAWIKSHPKDIRGALSIGQIYIRYGEYKEAIRLFESINDTENPKNAAVLNNLAWLYSQTGDKRALLTAKEAYELAPTTGAIVDTYGWILVKSGKLDQGILILRKASDLSGENDEIRLHLASALVKKGENKEEAKSILKSILEDGKLKGNPELLDLQKKLGIS